MRVLDLANVIAGPTIGAALARFGAEVTKIDPVEPTYAPETTVLYGLCANVGKRSVLRDVKDEESGGLDAFTRLVSRSDVLVANATSDSLARLKCSPKDLETLNPRLVLCRFDAWGGPNEGEGDRSGHLGYDDNIQAALGIMERFGGGLGRVEEHAHIGTVDVIAGVGGALARRAALYYQEKRRNQGLLVARASLASLGQLVQYPFCCGVPSQLAGEASDAPTALGPLCRGEHALLRCYEASDGEWLLLHASLQAHGAEAQEALARLAATHPALRVAVLKAEDDATLADALASAFRSSSLSAEEWVVRLQSHGLTAVALCSLSLLRARHAVPEMRLDGPSFQFLTDPEHPAGSALTYFAPIAVRPSKGSSPLVVPLPSAPKYGAHTREVLAEVGVDAELSSPREPHLMGGARTTCRAAHRADAQSDGGTAAARDAAAATGRARERVWSAAPSASRALRRTRDGFSSRAPTLCAARARPAVARPAIAAARSAVCRTCCIQRASRGEAPLGGCSTPPGAAASARAHGELSVIRRPSRKEELNDARGGGVVTSRGCGDLILAASPQQGGRPLHPLQK